MANGLFDGLDETVIAEITHHPSCYTRAFAKGEILYDQEHFSRQIGWILSGSAKVMNRKQGGVTIRTLSEGTFFGVASQFNESPTYVSCITALEPCRVLFMPQEAIRDGFRRSPELAENYLRFLISRICYLNGLIDAYSSPTVESKLARYLVTCAADKGATLSVNMSELSRILGAGRASLYRVMDGFEEKNWIHREGKTLEILDLDSLKDF